MNRVLSSAVLLGAVLLSSCDSIGNDTGVRDITAPLPSARIKFHNFSPSSVGVNFYANDQKMTAILTSACAAPATAADSTACATTGIESTTGVNYGGVGSGGRYDGIDAGQYTLTAKATATTASKGVTQGDVVASLSQTIADGKYYSYFVSGIYDNATHSAEAFVVEDPIPTGAIDYTMGYVRFVDAVPDATDDLILYATNTETSVETAVGGAVAYKSAGEFVSLPAGVYNLSARYAGSDVEVLSRSAVSVVGGTVRTITARGSTATASTLFLDNTTNQR
jgi:hypothetical protein